MIIVLVLYILIIRFKVKVRKDTNYLSTTNTICIKGIFVIMIFLSHFRQYIDNSDLKIYNLFLNFFGQRMVAIFLFYSGFGILESIKNKHNYMHSFLKKRFLKTFLHFELAMSIFIFLSLITGNIYSLNTYFLSLIGWRSIGNSTWFIFVLLSLYLITYIGYKISNNNNNNFIIITTVMCLIEIVILYFVKEEQWYNITMCYPLGLLYSNYISSINELLKKHQYMCLLILLFIFLCLFPFRRFLVVFELLACIFCLLIMNFTYIFEVGNKVLEFFGIYSFEIYMLQRVSLILLQNKINNYVIYLFVSFFITIVISYIFKKITNKIDGVLFKEKRVLK